MEKVNKLMKELELEINKLDPKDKNYLSIKSYDNLLKCQYEYSFIGGVTKDEFISLQLSSNDGYNDDAISMSLTLKDALNLQEHIGKLIKNYLVYDLNLDEEEI